MTPSPAVTIVRKSTDLDLNWPMAWYVKKMRMSVVAATRA